VRERKGRKGIEKMMRGLLTAMLAVSVAGQTGTQNIAELAQGTASLSTLVAALQAGDLVTTMSGAGPFTVFAPTDDAFDALPKGLVASLLQPANKDLLVKLLTYHVANGAVVSGDLSNGQTITTLEGSTVSVTLPPGGGVQINDATVTTADIDASNGRVHIINKVLLPPNFGKTIVDLAAATPDLSKLVTAVTAGDLVGTLSGAGPFTVFAPTNAAFDALPKGLVASLLKPENKNLLVELLTYHVVSGATLSSEITNNMNIATVEGSNIVATLPAGGGVKLNGDASVTTPDVVAANNVAVVNGVVHIIDKVLLPPNFAKTIVDLAVATPDLSTLVTAVTAADLVSTLSGPGPFTVFAPTNAAFNALPAGTLTDLLKPENKAQLVELLTYHVVSGATLSSEITNNMAIATVEGRNIVATLPAGGGVMINDARVTGADVVAANGVAATNGVVHIIDKVLSVPPPPPPSTAGASSLAGGSAVAGLVMGLLLAVAL